MHWNCCENVATLPLCDYSRDSFSIQTWHGVQRSIGWAPLPNGHLGEMGNVAIDPYWMEDVGETKEERAGAITSGGMATLDER